jgi:hypothetical protein
MTGIFMVFLGVCTVNARTPETISVMHHARQDRVDRRAVVAQPPHAGGGDEAREPGFDVAHHRLGAREQVGAIGAQAPLRAHRPKDVLVHDALDRRTTTTRRGAGAGAGATPGAEAHCQGAGGVLGPAACAAAPGAEAAARTAVGFDDEVGRLTTVGVTGTRATAGAAGDGGSTSAPMVSSVDGPPA